MGGARRRHRIGSALRRQRPFGRLLGDAFPWHTLTVNVLGCFIMGLLVELMALKLNLGNEMRAFLTTGILGGFTTFSAFSLDFALLAERKSFALAGAYAGASVFFSLAAVFRRDLSGTCSGTMTDVKRHVVTADEAGMRLDRWFKVHFPQVTFAYLNKLTRTARFGWPARGPRQHAAGGGAGDPRAAAGLRHASGGCAQGRHQAADNARSAASSTAWSTTRTATFSSSTSPSGFAVQGGGPRRIIIWTA